MTSPGDTGSAGILPAPGEGPAVRRSRGYLPHFDHPGSVQMVTFRLADALPDDSLSYEHGSVPADRPGRTGSRLDAGHGACLSGNPVVAGIVQDALLRFDGTRYHLIAWVIMPNHVHVLLQTMPGRPLASVLHTCKSFTATVANRALGRTGGFWQREYFDRVIRDEWHLKAAVNYIHRNPCAAGLVSSPELWEFSSAKLSAEGADRMPALPG